MEFGLAGLAFTCMVLAIWMAQNSNKIKALEKEITNKKKL